MKNKKTIIIILLVLVAYLVLMVILFGSEKVKDKFYNMDIMLSSGAKWHLEDGIWTDIKDEKNYNWKKFNVYVDNQLLGNYNLLYNKKWYVYDDEKNLIDYDGTIVGIKGNKKFKLINFDKSNFDSSGENILKSILKKENIDFTNNFQGIKITIDIDGDAKEEIIYTASNAFVEDQNITHRYSIIFIKDDETKIIYQDYQDASMKYSMCVPKINTIIDLDEDSKYELITECNYYSIMGTCTSLYEIKDDNYRLVKGC